MIDYKELRHFQCSYPLTIEWAPSGKSATVYVVADDRRATAATVSATTLIQWQADIADALAHRPNPNPDR